MIAPSDKALVPFVSVNDMMRLVHSIGIETMPSELAERSRRTSGADVVFMDKGEIVERAAPHSFFANPQNARTQQFLSQILSRH